MFRGRAAAWVGLGLGLFLLACLLVFVVAPILAESDNDVGDARTNAVQLIGGAVLAVGAVFTARSYRLNRTGQITERFTKAIEQLGSGKLEIKLGGIYALEQIARDDPNHHPQIMEVFTAYVREHAPWPARATSDDSPVAPEVDPVEAVRDVLDDLVGNILDDFMAPGPAADIQAIITVLVRRNTDYDRGPLDLRSVDLQRADLRGAHLEEALLMRSHLYKADLDSAHLERAVLMQADLNRCGLAGAHLENAKLHRAILSFARLQDAHLEGAYLGEARMDGVYASNASFEGAELNMADLSYADLKGANLRSAILQDVNLQAADLSAADLHEADLDSANLHEANLSSADLHGTGLKNVTLTKANLTGTSLANAQLRGAVYDRGTTWPKDLHPYRTGAELAPTDDEE
jgi:uncharacterized protein YjbI with pentapeptide repeats